MAYQFSFIAILTGQPTPIASHPIIVGLPAKLA
jgi:hypothetical protein